MSTNAIAGRSVLILLLALTSLEAETVENRIEPVALELQAYTMVHQPAEEAVRLLIPLLSEQGAVELQPGSNTVVVRDLPDRVGRVLQVLRDFDHPSSPVRMEIQIVRAEVGDASLGNEELLSPELVSRLKELLRYDNYRLLAGTHLAVNEGEQVSYRFGDEFGVGFRLGTLLENGRVKLHGFRILRDLAASGAADGFGERQLIHTNLNLWLGKPMILGLAKAESSDKALMVVLKCDLEGANE